MALTREFISFPKSGRSWLRYALTLTGVADDIRFHHDGFEYNDGARPPLDFDFQARLQRVAGVDRIVYLHRDPRDVMVSLFHQVTGRFKDFFNYQKPIGDFIRDPYFGAQNLAEFQRQWDCIAARGRALRITYEQCHTGLEAVLSSVLRYYEFPLSGVSTQRIAEESSFQRMKEVESSANFGQPWLCPRNGAPKVRRGIVGSFHDELGPADIAFLNELFGL
jgi:Sulfotransferase domain